MAGRWIAVTRPVSPAFAQCELTHRAREPIDVDRAADQHREYEQVLAALGARIVRAPALPEAPDSVFVEDTAVVLDEIAVVTRPGALTRRIETSAIASVLAEHRPVVTMTAPATLDGGDVLRIGRTLFVGRSSRTNAEGIEQLRQLVAPYAYRVEPVEVADSLHLKSVVTVVGDGLLLVNHERTRLGAFATFELVHVDPAEPDAANALAFGGAVVFPSHAPRTTERLLARGLRVIPVACDELAKAEGGVTCCSLLLEDRNADA